MQNELLDDLSEIVRDVNERYDSFYALSNDELREKLNQIEIAINNGSDKGKNLDTFLPDVFAIVKETARRFTEGSIIVTANNFDKYLASCYDFVELDGQKAIYRNKWEAGGQPVTWNMVHYDEQIMGGILLHRGYAVEMATGEGKTLVATLPVLLNALTHKGVHLMTSNSYLSKRDCELTRPIYMFHGLSVGCIEYYTWSVFGKKSSYKTDITFGTNSSFTFDYLSDHLAITPEDCVQQQHTYAIIDELDSILIDDAETPHIISGGNSYDQGKAYKDNIKLIKELIEDKTLYVVDTLNKAARFTSKGEKWLEQKTDIPDLYKIKHTYEIEDYDNLSNEIKDEWSKKLYRQNVLHQLLYALTLYERDIDYIVTNNRVLIVDQHTGRVKESNRWEHGLHTAIEVKEGVPTCPDHDGMAVISLKNYFKLYDKICGMSGTIMSAEAELTDIYNLPCAVLPTHKPCIRKDFPMQIFKTAADKDAEIIKRIIWNHDHGQPTLVGSLSVKRSEAIGQLLSAKGIPFNKLDAKTEKDEAYLVSKAGIGNTITVSTSIAGRGTDIKPSEDALANGGLVVVGTDLFDSIRVDRQLRGRTGRQGNPGSSVFYVSLEDAILKSLDTADKKDFDDIVSRIEDEDYNRVEVRSFFEKAQSNREMFFKSMRLETARKDDIIAPHRQQFYEQRNRVLFDSSISDSIITQIIKASGHNANEMTEHLRELYSKVQELVVRSVWNNSDRQKVFVPFSDARHVFAILFDVDFVKSNFDYFCREYKRQIILQVYDKLWKRFVIHVMGNLDRKEIEMLGAKYNAMMEEIKAIITSRILRASIPFDGRKRQHEGNNQPIDRLSCPTKPSEQILPDELCPCGSGKKYCECHGKGIHSIRQRRR